MRYRIRLSAVERIQLGLAVTYQSQSDIPAAIKFTRYESVVGIDGVVLALRMGCLAASLFERQRHLVPLLVDLLVRCLDRCKRRFDTERLKTVENLGADRLIDAQRTETDAWVGSMVDESAATVVATSVAVATGIANVKLTPTMTTAQESTEQKLAFAQCAAGHHALACGVIGDQTLVPLEIRPTEVTLMMVWDQDLPVGPLPPETADDALAPLFDGDTAASAAKFISAAIDRVSEDVVNGIVNRQLPDNRSSCLTCVADRWQHARKGKALLQSIAMCSSCGRRMALNYSGPDSTHPVNQCRSERATCTGQYYQEARAPRVETEAERQFLAALAPDRLAITLVTPDAINADIHGLERPWTLKREVAEDECERARRQYDTVEPENRLVARSLEAIWESKLRDVEKIEQDYRRWKEEQTTALSAGDRARIAAFGIDPPDLWQRIENSQRNAMLRLVIDKVILDQRRAKGMVWIRIVW